MVSSQDPKNNPEPQTSAPGLNDGASYPYETRDMVVCPFPEVKTETPPDVVYSGITPGFKAYTATMEDIKLLRERTSVGIGTCKKALEHVGGGIEAAIDYLRVLGELKAQDVVDRAAVHGGVFAYIHTGNRMGALVKVRCETDFVAKGELFAQFAKDVAMHVVATRPEFISYEDAVGSPMSMKEALLIQEQMEADPKMASKPAQMRQKVLDGKLSKRLKEVCLLEQPFVRDPTKTVDQLRAEVIQATGENIVVADFERFDMAEGAPTSMCSGCNPPHASMPYPPEGRMRA